MIAWLTHLQHRRAKTVWFIGILDEKLDDFNRHLFSPQIGGSRTGLELPGIAGQVITMAEIAGPDGQPARAFICQTLNRFGFPAKDRSGRLDMIEVPHLGQLMTKIHGPLRPAAARPRRNRRCRNPLRPPVFPGVPAGPSEGGRACGCVPVRRSSSSAAPRHSTPRATRWGSRPPVLPRRSCCRRSAVR